jgi:transcriptional regulator with XRE-family HTH domain
MRRQEGYAMFAQNLKRLRAAAGFTQASFAETLGLPLRTLQNWEQGKREPRLDTLPTLARSLGVPVSALPEEDAAPAGRRAKAGR